MAKLGVNVDHIATVRQARYRNAGEGDPQEPDPVALALVTERAGAHSITVHLREDRRHIQERDVRGLKARLTKPLNLEMAVTPAMQRFALDLLPAEVCLVPENRQEVTTEGGLDLLAQPRRLRNCVRALRKAGILVSLFIDPELSQIDAAAASGASHIELHTGAFALARNERDQARELARHLAAAELAHDSGLIVNAGHGLNYLNTPVYLRAVPHIHTLNIGHSIVSHALTVGLAKAVREMATLCRTNRFAA